MTSNLKESSLYRPRVSKRLNKRKRASKPPSMILQNRDKEIILAIYRYRFLSREQIENLFFNTTARANRRLNKLYHNGYLNRVFLSAATGSSQAVYCLDKKGVQEIAINLGTDISEIKWQSNNRVKSLFLKHTLAINDFHIALELDSRLPSGHELVLWLSENERHDTFSAWSEKNHQWENKTLNPDGYGQYRFGDKIFSFFLEMDMGTMSNKRLKEKFQRYMEYKNSGAYQERYGLRFFRVLVVTIGVKRLRNLKKIAGQAKADNIWLSTMEKVKENILGPIWQRTRSETWHSLTGEASS